MDIDTLIRQATIAVPTRPEPQGGEYAIATAVAAELQGRLRFDLDARQWYAYTGSIWQPTSTHEAAEVVVEAAERHFLSRISATQDKYEKQRLTKLLEAAYRARTVQGVLFFLAGQNGIATRASEWNQVDTLLPVKNGVIDLVTGNFRPYSPADMYTKTAGTHYDPQAQASRWQRFLREVFLNDSELIAFIQRAVGYSLTGWTNEQVFFFCYGTGWNGKGRFLETLLALLGDFGKYASFGTFTRERAKNGHEDDLMTLEGARFVASSESKTVGKLAEDVLKTIAGEDPITGSRKYERTRTFQPKFKLWLAANNKPRVDDVSDGFWRKVILIPFDASFKGKADTHLGEKLRAELPSILNWAIEGCLAYQQEGLNPPQRCLDAVAMWRSDNDPLADFLITCRTGDGLEVRASDLYQEYERYCATSGMKPISQHAFTPLMEAHGFKRERRKNGRFFVGIGI